MDQARTTPPPPSRPGSPRVHRLGLALAALAAVATFAGAAALTGGIAPSAAVALVATVSEGVTDAGTSGKTVVRTVYVPAPQPTAAPEPPVRIVVVNKPLRGDDEDEGREGEDD